MKQLIKTVVFFEVMIQFIYPIVIGLE